MSRSVSSNLVRSHSWFTSLSSPEIYTLSLHDALPIYRRAHGGRDRPAFPFPVQAAGRGHGRVRDGRLELAPLDRKSTRLNSSHLVSSYAVFCLKKKN